MSWRLIFALSGFGLAMGLATVFVIPSNIEPLVWLAVFALTALIIARYAPGKHFLHGFMTSLVNSVWITGAHVAFYDTYLSRHAEEAQLLKGIPVDGRVMMLITGPIVGLVAGQVIGLFAYAAGKFVKRAG